MIAELSRASPVAAIARHGQMDRKPTEVPKWA
jgi:hypothetical protein